MRVCIVGRNGGSIEARNNLVRRVQARGYEVVNGKAPSEIPKPFASHVGEVEAAQSAMVENIKRSDIVLICVPRDADANLYLQVGGALSLSLAHEHPRKRIYALGEDCDRRPCFFHPLVGRAETIEDLFQDHLPKLDSAQAAE